MSCSKWAYDPEKCDGDYCVGDCDYCHKADEEEVTVEEIVESVRWKRLGREIPKEELRTVSIDEIRGK